MADNVAITAGVGTSIATDDAGAGGHVQIVKLAISADGSATVLPGDVANGLDVDVTRSALPSGAATSAKQDTLLAELQAKADLTDTQPVSAAALPLPSGAASESTLDTRSGSLTETAPATDTASSGLNGRLQRVAQRLTALIALLPASLGQKAKAASLAVTIASDQDALPASQSGTWTVQPGNTANTTAWKVDGSAVTQPVSAASLPLPSGAATSANQSTDQTLTGGVTETAPATDTASSGLNGRLQRVAQRLTSLIGLLPTALGQTTMANSLAVTLASNQSAVTVDLTGATPVQFLDVDETEDEVKASAGKLHGYFLANLSAGVRYVKFYDGTAAGVTVGSTTPLLTIPLAAGEKANLALPRGLTFATGICVAATTGFAVADTGAPGTNDVIANVFFS